MSGDVVRTVAIWALWMDLCASGLACSERRIDLGDAGGSGGSAATSGMASGWQVLPDLGAHKVDLLFMVDNSQSMQPFQTKLIAGFPAFIDALQTLPNGPPDLHIAVISSDTGPGKYDLSDRDCQFGGDRGTFQARPRGSCAGSPLVAGQTFLEVVNGVPTYTGSLADALSCIALLGERGCGFEGPLKSVHLALDPVDMPATNRGFLRPEALLAVVMITNEDDCSLPYDSDLADPTQTRMSDPLGPFASFRCNEFGHLCNIGGQLVPPPRGAAEGLSGCVSNDTPTGKLTHVADEIAFLKGLKSEPNQIMVAAIAGQTTPYGIEMVQQGTDPEAHPITKHSCQTTTGEYADPSVRIQQWVNAFGNNGLMLPVCGDSMGPQLATVSQAIGDRAGYRCVTGPLPYSNGSTQPDCRVVDNFATQSINGVDYVSGQLVMNCLDNGGAAPCWTTLDEPQHCPQGGQVLKIHRGTNREPGVLTAFSCAPCPTDRAELGCLLSPHKMPDAGAFP